MYLWYKNYNTEDKHMAFYMTVLGIGGLDRTVNELKKDALKTVDKKIGYAHILDIKLHRVVIKHIGDKMEISEAYEEERLHKKKFNTNEELQTYLKEVQIEMSKPIIDVRDRDIEYWGISPWLITEEAPWQTDEETLDDLDTEEDEIIEFDYSDLDPEIAELCIEIDNMEYKE